MENPAKKWYLVILFLLISFSVHAGPSDYSPLIFKLKGEKNKEETPLYAFSAFENHSDIASHQKNLNYFNNRPELIRKIQADLDSREVNWKLHSSRQRLLFVPEREGDFAGLYENYCVQAINYVLAKTGFHNPYDKIIMLQQERPLVPSKGVRAYLVQNLVKEVVSTYVFSNPDNRSIMLKISNKTWLGEVGSFSSHLQMNGSDNPVFIKNNYTIWQTSAKNPFTALTVPLEETLHILLREYTHQAIKNEVLKRGTPGNSGDLKRLVDEWMAVEEALVGGLVHALLPPFLNRAGERAAIPDSYVIEDLQAREKFKKYKYLTIGVAVVKTIGLHEAIRLYSEDPRLFRQLLTPPEMSEEAGAGRSPSPASSMTGFILLAKPAFP